MRIAYAQPSSVEHRTPLATGSFQYLMNESLYTYIKRVFYPSLRLEAAVANI